MEDELQQVARYQTRSKVHKDLGQDSFSVFMEQIWCGKSAGPPYGQGNTMELVHGLVLTIWKWYMFASATGSCDNNGGRPLPFISGARLNLVLFLGGGALVSCRTPSRWANSKEVCIPYSSRWIPGT
jgi:hypothetical protein